MLGNKGFARQDYQPVNDSELRFSGGDLITEIQMVSEHWCSGRNEKGETGFFPGDAVEQVYEPVGFELS